jgi:hypothetical protein
MSEAESETDHGAVRVRRLLTLEPVGLSQLIQIGLFVGVLLASLKILAVSNGDIGVALALLNFGGYLRPLITILVSFGPSSIAYALIGLRIYSGAHKEAGQPFRYELPMFYILYTLLIFGVFAMSGISFLGFAALYILVSLFESKVVRRRERKVGTPVSPKEYITYKRNDALASYGTLIILALATNLSTGFTNANVFGPREQITADGSTYYGSLVGQKDDWSAILTDKAQLYFVRSDEIKSRSVCKQTTFKPLIFWLLGDVTAHTSNLKCPEVSN